MRTSISADPNKRTCSRQLVLTGDASRMAVSSVAPPCSSAEHGNRRAGSRQFGADDARMRERTRYDLRPVNWGSSTYRLTL